MRIDIQKNQEASDGLFVRCITFRLHHALQKNNLRASTHLFFHLKNSRHIILLRILN